MSPYRLTSSVFVHDGRRLSAAILDSPLHMATVNPKTSGESLTFDLWDLASLQNDQAPEDYHHVASDTSTKAPEFSFEKLNLFVWRGCFLKK